MQKLAERAENLLRITGNRILASVMHAGIQPAYDPQFIRCSQEPEFCLDCCQGVSFSSYDGPVPPTFASRRFLHYYGKKDSPNVRLLTEDDEIWRCVRDHVTTHLKRNMAPVDAENEARAFVKSLKREVVQKAGNDFISEMLDDCEVIAQRLWTSALTDSTGTELFTYLNRAIRSDSEDTAETTAQLVRCINQLVVNRRGINVERLVTTLVDKGCPPVYQSSHAKYNVLPTGFLDNDEAHWCVTFRGGGIASYARRFFEPGQTFRTPQYLATSFKKAVALNFMSQRGEFEGQLQEAVIWYVHVSLFFCHHAALVEKSNISNGGEQTPEFEYLFAPFSVFTVQRVKWSTDPSNMAPHEIHLMASFDNANESDDLPTSPWC